MRKCMKSAAAVMGMLIMAVPSVFLVQAQAGSRNQVMADKIVVKKTGAYKQEIRMGQKLPLEYTISDPDADVTFESSNPSAVAVDETGTATGVKPGYSIIKVIAPDGSSDKWRVTVRKPHITIVNSYKVKMKVGDSAKLKYKDTGEGAAVTFTASNKKVTVTEDGLLTANEPGVSEVFGSIAYGNKVKWRIETAKPKLKVVGPRIIKFKVGSRHTVKYSDTGENLPITFSSSDEKVVTVDENGVVTAVKKGRAVVYAKIKYGNTIKWTFHVKEAPVISHNSVTLEEGESIQLKVSGTTKTPFWVSSDMRTAIVSENGLVTGRNPGTAKITVKVGKKDLTVMTCKVTVKRPSSKKPEIKAALEGKENAKTEWLTLNITNNGNCTLRIFNKGAFVTDQSNSSQKMEAKLYCEFNDKKIPRTFIDVRAGDSETIYFSLQKNVVQTSALELSWNCIYDAKDYEASIRFGSKKVSF